jgi:hypothetical protein
LSLPPADPTSGCTQIAAPSVSISNPSFVDQQELLTYAVKQTHIAKFLMVSPLIALQAKEPELGMCSAITMF